MALLNKDWWTRGGAPILKGEANVETADVAALNITSELLSGNALRRSVIVALPALGAASTTPYTSANTVFTPSKPIALSALSLMCLTSWIQTTLQTTPVGTLFAGNNIVGTVVIPTTNAPARGSVLAFSALPNVNVSSGTALTFGLPVATSAGMTQPSMLLQIDFDSTG